MGTLSSISGSLYRAVLVGKYEPLTALDFCCSGAVRNSMNFQAASGFCELVLM